MFPSGYIPSFGQVNGSTVNQAAQGYFVLYPVQMFAATNGGIFNQPQNVGNNGQRMFFYIC